MKEKSVNGSDANQVSVSNVDINSQNFTIYYMDKNGVQS